MPNRMKALLTEGKPACGAQLRYGSPAIAELFGYAGFDWIVIDSEHAPQTPVGIQAQLQAFGGRPSVPIARIPRVDQQKMLLYLDMGALGILAAFVNTPEEAEIGARACRYPPRGNRGWGPHRAARYGLQKNDDLEALNNDILFIPMIESEEAVRNLEDILSVDGVDTFVIGPVDLSISLGVPFDFENSIYQDAEREALRIAERVGKPAGTGVYRDPMKSESLREFVLKGFNTLLFGGDEMLLADGCRTFSRVIEELKGSDK